jgi:hypothetical protein
LSTNPATPVVRPATNSPGVSESNDWVGPLARQMGIKNKDIDGNNSVLRYNAYRNLGWMICPSYRDMPVPWSSGKSDSGTDAGPGQGLSYNIALAFVCKAWETFSTSSTALNGNLIPPLSGNGKPIIGLPRGYGPRMSSIRDGSRKIFAADGARTVLPSASGGQNKENPPFYVISGDPSRTNWDNTSYGDWGAFGGWSHSYYRTAVPGNATNTPSQDVRVWAYRHGALRPFQPPGSYLMTVVYFDGHGATLNDVEAANPALWMPTGSVIYPTVGCSGNAVAGTKTVWSDCQPKYCPGVSGNSQAWISP